MSKNIRGNRCASILLVVAVGSACGSITPDDPDVDATAAPDGPTADSAPPIGWHVERVPNVNTSAREGHPSATADDLELYFHREIAGSGSDLMVATRASTADAWGVPGPARDVAAPLWSPEVSPDGLELFFVASIDSPASAYGVSQMRRVSRAAAWPATATDGRTFPVSLGGVSLTGDGLTAYYATPEFSPRLRRRATVTTTTWGAEEMIPGLDDDARKYRFVSVDAAALVVVLTGPVRFGPSGVTPPAVITLARASTADPFTSSLEITALTDAPAFEACDMFGPASAFYCQRDTGGNLELYRAERGE